MKKKLAIIGSGDLGQLIAHHAKSCNFEIVGFYDDFQTQESAANKFTLLGKVSDIENDFEVNKFDEISIAIGYKHLEFKEQIIQILLAQNIPLASIIHPSAYIDSSAKIGKGVTVLPHTTVDAGCEIEDGVLLNTGVCIAHDTKIKTCCFIAPAAALAGFIKIEKRCFIGINSTIIDNISICQDTKIGAGAVVTKSITEKGLYVGIPAKKIKSLK
ncbi:acetyltransferase [Bernardetia sp. ABR2-2B]|uniref:acetyltransferase n=1 Tax=Bernardetia sp. ABR2-2B TaxID=3127472 RepID=UPI0030CF2683